MSEVCAGEILAKVISSPTNRWKRDFSICRFMESLSFRIGWTSDHFELTGRIPFNSTEMLKVHLQPSFVHLFARSCASWALILPSWLRSLGSAALQAGRPSAASTMVKSW